MTVHKCPRCGYATSYTTNFRAHLTRKTICRPLLDDVSLDHLIQNLEAIKADNQFECQTCHNFFKNKQTLRVHQKKCGSIHQNEAILHQIASLLTKLTNQDQVSSITNNIHNQNIQNIQIINIGKQPDNIQVNNFLGEDISYLSDDYIMKCAKRLDNGLVDLIKTIRFNPDHPENMNVRMHVKRDKTLYVFNNGSWEVSDAQWTLEEMIVQGAKIINQRFLTYSDQEKLMEDGSSESQIQNWLLSLLPRNDRRLIGKISKRVYALILSNQVENQDVVVLIEKSDNENISVKKSLEIENKNTHN